MRFTYTRVYTRCHFLEFQRVSFANEIAIGNVAHQLYFMCQLCVNFSLFLERERAARVALIVYLESAQFICTVITAYWWIYIASTRCHVFSRDLSTIFELKIETLRKIMYDVQA